MGSYSDIPLFLSLVFVFGGLLALAWSSDAFVDGAASVARRLGISPFIIGMVIIGFGTCAPEFCVSLFSGSAGKAELSLGNAYGSCIFNVAGVLGIAAMVRPLVVRPIMVFLAAPLLALTTLLSFFILGNNELSKFESWLLIAIFLVLMPLYCWADQRSKAKPGDAGEGGEAAGDAAEPSVWKTLFNLVVGFSVMVGASHLLVWGSVDIAAAMGVSELMIGLTIVAIGTSVPELATAVAAAKKGHSELVLGNIVGSNLFNALVVIGTAGTAAPGAVGGFSPYVMTRDLPMLLAVSILVGVFGFNRRRPRENGSINRLEGALWTLSFIIYMIVMVYQEICK